MNRHIRRVREKIDKIEIEKIVKGIVILIIVLIVLLVLSNCIDSAKYKEILFLGNILSMIIALITIALEVVAIYRLKTRKKYKYREYLVEELIRDDFVEETKQSSGNTQRKKVSVNESIKEKSDNRDIIALMLKNHDEINEYFRISKSQAKVSFWLSVFACVFGLLVFLYGIYSAVVLKAMEVTVISVISGAIAELIAATVFWVHNKSALQLNHYYAALHENEKFLSAVNMTDKLSDDNREEIIMEIIRNQIYVQGK